jgi:thiol-disulfide isomerase/thioredoxin
MKRIILTILLMLSTALLAESSTQTLQFTLTDIDDNIIHITKTDGKLTFEEYKGKAVFLVIFGHQCPPCKAEIPELIELTKEYKDELEIVAIEAQNYTVDELKSFRDMEKINYHLVTGKDHENFLMGHIARNGWSGSIPFLIAMDKNGTIKFADEGLIPTETLESLVKKLTK